MQLRVDDVQNLQHDFVSKPWEGQETRRGRVRGGFLEQQHQPPKPHLVQQGVTTTFTTTTITVVVVRRRHHSFAQRFPTVVPHETTQHGPHRRRPTGGPGVRVDQNPVDPPHGFESAFAGIVFFHQGTEFGYGTGWSQGGGGGCMVWILGVVVVVDWFGGGVRRRVIAQGFPEFVGREERRPVVSRERIGIGGIRGWPRTTTMTHLLRWWSSFVWFKERGGANG